MALQIEHPLTYQSTACSFGLYLAFELMQDLHRVFFTSLFLLTGLFDPINAQDTVLNGRYKGKLDSLHSEAMGQQRLFQVFVPPSWKPGDTSTYEVLYVLDGGNWNTGLVTRIQQFTEGEGNMPPVMVVSIMGIDRNIELTPTRLTTWNAPTGGAEKFLQFITHELIPYIGKTYPANGDNTLWGHSLSALFAIYALLNEPTAFRSFIAVDPSCWWDDNYVPKQAAKKLPSLPGLQATLFVAGREGAALHDMRIDTMATVLQKNAPPGLHWKLMTYQDESHSSVRLKSTYDGLRFTYAGIGADIELLPAGGRIVKGQPIQLKYFDDTARMHYTLDGSIPTESSPVVPHELPLSGAATVTYKRFTNRQRLDKTATAAFTAAEKVLPPLAELKNATPGGWHYSYTEANGTRPQTGIALKDFEKTLPRKNSYALTLDGWLQVKEDGYHMFFFQGTRGSKLFIGETLVMQFTDSNHTRSSYILPLSKGFYPLRIEYADKKEDYTLLLYWIAPSIMAAMDAVPVPLEQQFSKRRKE